MWRIYYEDGSVYSSEDGAPFDAPRTGVQVIAYRNPLTGKIDRLSQADFYYYEPERCDWGWWHCGPVGMTLHLQRAKRPLILFGSMVPTALFDAVERRALTDIPDGDKGVWRRGMDKADAGVVNDG